MRVVFMGTPAFSVPSLDMLLRRHTVAAVYTRPDRPTGRGRRIVSSPVKQRALEAGCRIEQPPTLRDDSVADVLSALAPDVVVVAAYGLILPRAVLRVPGLGCVNVHASLLPRWRGAAPVQRAILAGDETTGVAIMRMEEGLDTGPYALRIPVPVGERDTEALTGDLAAAGALALERTLDAMSDGCASWTVQDDSKATYAPKVSAADVGLEPSLEVEAALRRVRASSHSAPCRILLEGRRITVLEASTHEGGPGPGIASCEGGIVLGMTDGAVRIDRLVPEGRKPMSGADFSRGAHLGASCAWGPA